MNLTLSGQKPVVFSERFITARATSPAIHSTSQDAFQIRFGSNTPSPLKPIADLYLSGQNLDINSLTDPEGNNVLMSLIKSGDHETAFKVLQDHRTILSSAKNRDGAYLGHVAAQFGTPELIQALCAKDPTIQDLVQVSANLNDKDLPLRGSFHEATPLVVSALSGKTENAIAWLQQGANPNVKLRGAFYPNDEKNAPSSTHPDYYSPSLTSLVIRSKNQVILDELLKDPKLDTNEAFLVSVITENADAMQKLLAHPKTEIDTTDRYGRSAFWYAASRKTDEPMKLLLESANFKALSPRDQKVTLMIKGEYGDEASASPMEIVTQWQPGHPNVKTLLETTWAGLSHIK